MGRRVVYIIVEDLDGRDGSDIALKLENGAQSIELKGGGEELRLAGTESKADTIELKGGERRTIGNPANQEALLSMAHSERDDCQTNPTSAHNDDTIQPKPFRKRLGSHFRNLTWETIKTAFRALIGVVVRFFFNWIIY